MHFLCLSVCEFAHLGKVSPVYLCMCTHTWTTSFTYLENVTDGEREREGERGKKGGERGMGAPPELNY